MHIIYHTPSHNTQCHKSPHVMYHHMSYITTYHTLHVTHYHISCNIIQYTSIHTTCITQHHISFSTIYHRKCNIIYHHVQYLSCRATYYTSTHITHQHKSYIRLYLSISLAPQSSIHYIPPHTTLYSISSSHITHSITDHISSHIIYFMSTYTNCLLHIVTYTIYTTCHMFFRGIISGIVYVLWKSSTKFSLFD